MTDASDAKSERGFENPSPIPGVEGRGRERGESLNVPDRSTLPQPLPTPGSREGGFRTSPEPDPAPLKVRLAPLPVRLLVFALMVLLAALSIWLIDRRAILTTMQALEQQQASQTTPSHE